MILATVTADAAVRYVTQEGAGNRDGSRRGRTHTTKPPSPTRSRADTVAGDEFWVKAGVYRPLDDE